MLEIGQAQDGLCRGAFRSRARLPLHDQWPPCHRSIIEGYPEGKFRFVRDTRLSGSSNGPADFQQMSPWRLGAGRGLQFDNDRMYVCCADVLAAVRDGPAPENVASFALEDTNCTVRISIEDA